jgi:hypothetical protein
MPRVTIIAVVALYLLCAVSAANAQGVGVNVNTVFSPQLQIGGSSTATVTVSNAGNATVELLFVGVHFEWDNPTVWYIGGHSGEGAILGSGEEISYDIAVGVPANVTTGAHKFFTIVKYRMRTAQGNWTVENDLFWVQPVQIGTGQASSSQTPQGPQQSFTPETIALLVVATVAGLFLERDSVKMLFKKPGSKEPKSPESVSTEPKSTEPASTEVARTEQTSTEPASTEPKKLVQRRGRKVAKSDRPEAGVEGSPATST